MAARAVRREVEDLLQVHGYHGVALQDAHRCDGAQVVEGVAGVVVRADAVGGVGGRMAVIFPFQAEDAGDLGPLELDQTRGIPGCGGRVVRDRREGPGGAEGARARSAGQRGGEDGRRLEGRRQGRSGRNQRAPGGDMNERHLYVACGR